MGVMMQGGGDKPTIWYQPVPLTGLYLRCAYKAAASTLQISDTPEQIEKRIEQAILTILWSTLALEAGVNEFAENILPVAELLDFDKCRKKYKKPSDISRTMWKWRQLFKVGPKIEISLTEPFYANAETLMQLRHSLTHYKLQDTARKNYYQPSPPVKQEDGMFHQTMWHAGMMPTKVEPSLIERSLLKQTPTQFFMAARGVFFQWGLKNGEDESKLNETIPVL